MFGTLAVFCYIPAMQKQVELTGERFGSLVVFGRAPKKGKVSRWFCRCDCGNEFVSRSDKLRGGLDACRPCREHRSGRPINHRVYSGGLTRRYPSEYNAWRQLRFRCSSPTRAGAIYYFERGITVCERWNRFDTFLADMGPKPSPIHSIDRIDVDGNYEPSNCRWATPLEQSRNRRCVKKAA